MQPQASAMFQFCFSVLLTDFFCVGTDLWAVCLRPIPTSCKSDFTGLPATLMAPTIARDSTLAQDISSMLQRHISATSRNPSTEAAACECGNITASPATMAPFPTCHGVPCGQRFPQSVHCIYSLLALQGFTSTANGTYSHFDSNLHKSTTYQAI